MTADSVQILSDLARHPWEAVRAWKQRTGRPAVGIVCTCVPEEVLHAAGMLPVRLFGFPTERGVEGSRLPTMSCAFSRRMLEYASSGILDGLEGIVFPHACDTIRSIASILNTQMPARSCFHLNNPLKLDGHALQLMTAEILRLVEWMDRQFGRKVTEASLRDSIRIYNENRRLLRELYASRRQGALSTSLVMRAVLAGMVCPKEDHTVLLKSLQDAKGTAKTEDSGAPRIVIAGNLCSSVSLLESIEDLGLRIVDDDLCTGSRAFAEDVGEREDPVWALANRYLARTPCPIMVGNEGVRESRLIRLVEDSRAAGVVFLLLKFCDPHFFDLPLAKKALDRKGIPSIVFEHENDGQILGQARTRLEAFLEMIGTMRVAGQ